MWPTGLYIYDIYCIYMTYTVYIWLKGFMFLTKKTCMYHKKRLVFRTEETCISGKRKVHFGYALMRLSSYAAAYHDKWELWRVVPILSITLSLSLSHTHTHTHTNTHTHSCIPRQMRANIIDKKDLYFWQNRPVYMTTRDEGWGAAVETQKNVRGEIGGWGRVPFNEPYAPS